MLNRAVLREYAIKGFVLDKKRLENGIFLNKKYFEELLKQKQNLKNTA